MTRYQIEWFYLQELPASKESLDPGKEAHCSFLLRFPDIPQGKGHCTFFAINLISEEGAIRLGIPLEGKRGYWVVNSISQDDFKKIVEQRIAEAFNKGDRSKALQDLNHFFIDTTPDFRDEFRKDLIPVEVLRILIDFAFENVVRGNGVTLHEAVAEDDYLSKEECLAARKKDPDVHWRDVPTEHLANHPEFLTYLDSEGLRYYLPAVMMFALNFNDYKNMSDTPQRAYWILLPSVAPRDVGKGYGETFDVAAYAKDLNLTQNQILVCYRFVCYMAIEADEGVDEDQYPAMCKWRTLAGLH
ncbi:DUF6714 family protein [Leptospira noguchii]|uniref:Uncharacterized protein n=1 Tax=Leptospira noguchii serovar Panama str. CZ214 TaxID=1001595 RepID=T0F895_9LEPT|nr:DUF6714 family protein [Leptospira noguchii]EQA69443.1 hypothetical protein LEP1GSC059_2294 [Leptospira noguchii serovar Panama str. CZ214]